MSTLASDGADTVASSATAFCIKNNDALANNVGIASFRMLETYDSWLVLGSSLEIPEVETYDKV